MNRTCTIGPYRIGSEHPLLLIAGPCVLEKADLHDQIVTELKAIGNDLGIPYVFKGSFDKANRSSIHSDRGPGLDEGLRELERIGREHDVPIVTDLHEPEQASAVGQVVDMLQIPAFLCRQTDLLLACAKTGKPVNVKKGQFMSPAEMTNVVTKLEEGDCENILLTERGTFFGYHRLVNDFLGLGDLMEIGPPVCFDVTHSTQLPGGGQDHSTGRPERAALLARAATAAGVQALFIETHPDPDRARSDAGTVQPLAGMRELLESVMAIHHALSTTPSSAQ